MLSSPLPFGEGNAATQYSWLGSPTESDQAKQLNSSSSSNSNAVTLPLEASLQPHLILVLTVVSTVLYSLALTGLLKAPPM